MAKDRLVDAPVASVTGTPDKLYTGRLAVLYIVPGQGPFERVCSDGEFEPFIRLCLGRGHVVAAISQVRA